MRRVLLLVLVGLLLLPPPARAVGTGGIEVTPYPGVVDGKQVTAFHVKVPSRGSADVRYSLRNTSGKAVSGRLYAASATRDGDRWTIGDPGSAEKVAFADRRVTLQPGEVRIESFQVRGPVERTEHAAVVVEVQQGAVVARAATLVYLERGRRVPLPVLLVGAAALLVLLAGGAVLRVRRGRPATEG